MAGNFFETVDFDPGSGTTNLTAINGSAFFVLKLDTEGNFIWARSFGNVLYDQPIDIGVDASGNIYTVGNFMETADFDPGTESTNLTSAGSHDIFVQKLDAAGNFLWAFSLGGNGSEGEPSIITDEFGNVIVAGTFAGTVDFDPETGTANLTSTGGRDVFVMKTSTDGSFLWAKSFGGTLSEDCSSISVDASGNIYLAGVFTGIVDFDPGSETLPLEASGVSSMFLQKLDSSGNLIWAKSIDSDYAVIDKICTDDDGNLYSVGRIEFTTDFDPGPGTAIVVPHQFSETEPDLLPDAFILKIDTSGNFLWVKVLSGNEASTALLSSIDIDNNGNICTTGFFQGNIDFNPGQGTFNIFSELMCMFILKLSQGTEINGYVFIDANENGTMDEDEIPVPNQSVSYYNMSDVAVTNESGFFRAFPPAGNQEFNYQPPSYYTNTTPVSQTIEVQTGVIDTLYFGITSSSDVSDLVADIHAYDSPRPGFTRNYLLSYQNAGTTTLDDVTLKFLKTAEDDLVLASGAYTVSDDTLIWNLGTLEPYSYGSFTITHTLSAAATLGASTLTQAWIIPSADDATPENNVVSLNEEIIGSYDPNDKSVTPESSYPMENEPLEYTIRFQNTGNYHADFVIVKDTLDAQLDLSSFQMIAASHNYEVEIINRIATWTFNEIYLPDSTSDEAGSHGFIKFKVQRVDGLDVGDQIPNRVAIYFDYNEPVITNTCVYSIVSCISTGTDIQTACNSYTWLDGNTYTSSNNTATYVLENALGCDSIVTLNLTIHSVSNIGTTLNGATITANNNNATYQWLDCDNNNAPIAGATSQTYTATEDGNYAVAITENGCTNTSACVAVTIIGIDELSNGLQASVYPNPSQGQVEIALGTTMQDVELVLTDVQGKLVFKRNYPSLFKTNIELPEAKGVYFLKINAKGSNETIKLVKE